MCDFKKARQTAQAMFVENGYPDKVPHAFDLPDKWIFISSHFEEGITDYGSCPISVDKELGIPRWYQGFSPENIDEFLNAKPIMAA